MQTYTTKGSVRGCCGHRHKTIRTALDCLARDQTACHNFGVGCYSDRQVRRVDTSATGRRNIYTAELSEAETDVLYNIEADRYAREVSR